MVALKNLNEKESFMGLGAVEAVYRTQFVLEMEADGTILSANEKFINKIGHQIAELKGRNCKKFLAPEHIESGEIEELWAKLKAGLDGVGEFKFVTKGEREIWLSGSFSPIIDEHGTLINVVCIGADITHTRLELKVRSDILNLTSIVSEGDLKGNILSVNEKYQAISQYSQEELLGQGHNITRHEDMPKEVFKEMWSTIGRGKIFRGKIKNKAKDGSAYYVDAVIAPIMGENGKPEKYLGVRYDITETEIEHQNMRGMLGAVDASFAHIEFDNKGIILNANNVFTKTLGYSESDLIGKHHRMFCSSEYSNSSEYSDFWRALANGESKDGVFNRKDHAGKDIWLHSIYYPVLDDAGHVTKVIKIATDMTDHFEMIAEIQETATALSGASTELTATASEMSRTSEQTSQESIVASAAAEEVSAGVQTVATNIEEMVASIKEIGRSTSESSQMAKNTLERAQESNATVTKLGISSQEIGDVIKVISSIAQQTNLLALNATIEAARAGDAGRGFAVVANEVKELAKQTAKATADITNKIGAIQSDTKSAIEAIAGISISVEKLNGISSVIAAAVEEQTATTNEISRVVVESKKGVESIAETIRHVSMAANESSTSSGQTLEASQELARLADKLSALTKKH